MEDRRVTRMADLLERIIGEHDQRVVVLVEQLVAVLAALAHPYDLPEQHLEEVELILVVSQPVTYARSARVPRLARLRGRWR